MTFLKTSQTIFALFMVVCLSKTVSAQACVSAHNARPMIKKHGLKTISQLRRQIPGQILNVKLCGSGRSAVYHVLYKKSGKSGNERLTVKIRAR